MTVSDVPRAPEKSNDDAWKLSVAQRRVLASDDDPLHRRKPTCRSDVGAPAARFEEKRPRTPIVPRIDDFGGEGVALLREYFDMMPAGVLPALKADFLISLFCFRIGNPKGKRQSLGIGSEMARGLGEPWRRPFGVRDLEALLVSDLVEDRHEEDPKERIPWIVFTAWAARPGFPSWRGGDAVALGRALRPHLRLDVRALAGGASADPHPGEAVGVE